MTKRSIASRKLWKLGIKDFNTQFFDYNNNGDLIAKEGNNIYNLRYLAEKFGTSLEILFPYIIEERVEDLLDLSDVLIKKLKYQGKFYYHYPMKSNQTKEVVLAMVGEGANIETSSFNELYIVKKMLEQQSFNEKMRILCNGPKTDRYINLIDELQHRGLKIIPIIEGPAELKTFQNSKYDVGIRLDIPVKSKSNWNKEIDRFGFTRKEILKMSTFKNLKVLHYRIGNIEKLSDLVESTRYALDVYFKLKEKNPSLDTLDIGGGMPIPYERNKKYSAEKILEKLFQLLKKESDKRGISNPNLICEWGRYMVAPAQITIFKVIDTKIINHKGIEAKKWYVIDGSLMNDLIDTWAIGQKWFVAPISNKFDSKLNDVWISGSSCDSDDVYTGIGGSVSLPDYNYNESNESFYIAFFDTGAYQDALASHHCMLSSPIKIIAENGHIVVARKRETPEDVGKDFGW